MPFLEVGCIHHLQHLELLVGREHGSCMYALQMRACRRMWACLHALMMRACLLGGGPDVTALPLAATADIRHPALLLLLVGLVRGRQHLCLLCLCRRRTHSIRNPTLLRRLLLLLLVGGQHPRCPSSSSDVHKRRLLLSGGLTQLQLQRRHSRRSVWAASTGGMPSSSDRAADSLASPKASVRGIGGRIGTATACGWRHRSHRHLHQHELPIGLLHQDQLSLPLPLLLPLAGQLRASTSAAASLPLRLLQLLLHHLLHLQLLLLLLLLLLLSRRRSHPSSSHLLQLLASPLGLGLPSPPADQHELPVRSHGQELLTLLLPARLLLLLAGCLLQ